MKGTLISLIAVALLCIGCGPAGPHHRELDSIREILRAQQWEDVEARIGPYLEQEGDPELQAEALFLRGLARRRMDRCEEARADWAAARRLSSSIELMDRCTLQEARCLVHLGDADRALPLLEPLIGSPERARSWDALLLTSEILLTLDRTDEARRLLQRGAGRAPDEAARNELELRLARLELDLGLESQGERRLQNLQRAPGIEDSWSPIHRLLAERALAAGEYAEAVRQLVLALEIEGEPAAPELIFQLREALAASGDQRTIQDILDREDLPARLVFELGRHLVEERRRCGESQEVEPLVEHLSLRLAGTPWATAMEELDERIRLAAGVDAGRIGLLLPLQGRLASYSLRVIHGASLAMQAHNEAYPEAEVRLIRADVGAAPPSEVLERLVREEEVIAVIGPLMSETARAVAETASRLGIPLVTPGAPGRDVPDASPYLFRCSLTPRMETRALVDRAVYNLGLSNFAVLHPETPTGEELRDAFLEAAGELEVPVVAVVGYPQGISDFSGSMVRLQGRVFDGLFVADGPREAGLIAPQLLFHDLKEILLLGTNRWNDPQLIEVGGPYAEDAIFTEAYFDAPQHPEYAAFRQAYLEAFGEPPDALASHSYEATSAVLATLVAGARSREQVREGLMGKVQLPGLMGVLRAAPNGELERPIQLLTVSQRRIRELDWELLPLTWEAEPAPPVIPLASEPPVAPRDEAELLPDEPFPTPTPTQETPTPEAGPEPAPHAQSEE